VRPTASGARYRTVVHACGQAQKQAKVTRLTEPQPFEFAEGIDSETSIGSVSSRFADRR